LFERLLRKQAVPIQGLEDRFLKPFRKTAESFPCILVSVVFEPVAVAVQVP